MSVKTMKIHFIGIGGIGVSALARYYLKKGHKVSGSDLAFSEITTALEKLGAKIIIGPHKRENLPENANLVIFSPAIKPDNPELKAAYKIQDTKYKIQIMSYPEALGELTKNHFTIAVSGTHGKSTTTAMLGLLLTKAGLNPTVILGTKLKEFGDSNCRVGGYPTPKSKLLTTKYLVIEADEHFGSFLNYWPKIIVLTNIEKDHLDYYKNLKNILKTFKEYVGHLPEDGWLVGNGDDANISKLKTQNLKLQPKTQDYSLKQKDAKKLKNILKIPGEHNVSNGLAALAVARILKIPDFISFKALSEYKGAWRRFEEKELKMFVPTKISSPKANKLENCKLKIISDYGHHPTEVKVTLKAAREKYPDKKIWCVFQPHQYQRTYYLFKDFVKILQQAQDKLFIDKLIITDIYDVAGRENAKIKKKVSAEKLAKAIKRKNAIYLPKKEILNYLKKNLRDGEILIMMGAGDIYDFAALLDFIAFKTAKKPATS